MGRKIRTASKNDCMCGCGNDACFACNPVYEHVLLCQSCGRPSGGGRLSSWALIRAGKMPKDGPDNIACCYACFSALQTLNPLVGYFAVVELDMRRNEKSRL